MKRSIVKVGAVIMSVFLMAMLGGVGLALAQPIPVPGVQYDDISFIQVISGIGNVVNMVKTGVWLPAIALLLTVIIRIFKTQAFGGLIGKIPAETRILIPTMLGFIVGLLALLAGHSIVAAFFIAVTTGPTSVYWHHLLDWLCKRMGWK